MSAADIVILSILGAVALGVIVWIAVRKRKGKSSCGCETCAGCAGCEERRKKCAECEKAEREKEMK